jgi:Ca-activated chloride channel family protein
MALFSRLRSPSFLLAVLIIALALLSVSLVGQTPENSPASSSAGDHTLSPYFWIRPSSLSADGPAAGAADALPLKSTHVDVSITGTFANVVITQHYANRGAVPLEAVYIFPGSTRAAVHGLMLTVGDRHIEAKVKEKEAARQTYETAKQQGKTASLLEQHRPNVFQMNVANILPGDEVAVELHYTELLVPTDGVYDFVFPTVVGPRYSNREAQASGGADHAWVANPYLHKDEPDPASFALDAHLVAGVPLQEVVCPTHDCKIEFVSEKEARIRMADTAKADRDFILRFALAGPQLEAGLVLGASPAAKAAASGPISAPEAGSAHAPGIAENFFLFTVQPPARVKPAEMPAREYDFIVDVSGSMNGFPLDVAKRLATDLLSHLRPQDSFNVLLFSGSSRTYAPRAVAATPTAVQEAADLINGEQGGGGTELLPALKKAFAMPANDNVARSFLVITDGYVDVEPEAFEFVRSNLGRANLFAFGIGSSVNRHLMEGLARVGQGEPFIATNPESATDVANKFREYISAPLLTHIQVTFDGFDAYDVEPAQVADVFANRPVVSLGNYHGEPRGEIVVTGTTGMGEFRAVQSVASATMADSNEGLARVWARSRIASIGDLFELQATDERKAQITNLGLTYNLLTKYTSFVAVDDVVRRTNARLETMKQPLPMPAGVEDSAVGGTIAAAPEPSTYALFGVGLLVVVVALRRNRRQRREQENDFRMNRRV